MAAITLGAVAIEKHFTLDRQKGGEDSAFSIEPLELSNLVKMAKELWQSLRDTSWERNSEEVENRKFRRSIYFVQSLKKGDQVTRHNVQKIRPGFGLPPKYFEDIIGPWSGAYPARTTGRFLNTTRSFVNYLMNCPEEPVYLEEVGTWYSMTSDGTMMNQ